MADWDWIPDDPRYQHPWNDDPVPWCPECGSRDLRVKFALPDGTRRFDTRVSFDPVIYCLDCLAGSIDRTDRDGRRIMVDMRMFASCTAQRERKHGHGDVREDRKNQALDGPESCGHRAG